MSADRGSAEPSASRVRAFDPAKVPRPTRVPELKLPKLPLDVEIGCGVGLHPIRYASAHPERYLVAIEHTRNRYLSFEQRVRNHPGLSNLLPVHADGVAWVTHFLKPETVEKYFFLYPNPNPKKADLNKRWHAMPFMARVIETLRPGGTIQLATNERFYFEEALDYFGSAWGLVIESAREIRSETPPGFEPRTHFERKYLARGETCFDLVVRKP